LQTNRRDDDRELETTIADLAGPKALVILGFLTADDLRRGPDYVFGRRVPAGFRLAEPAPDFSRSNDHVAAAARTSLGSMWWEGIAGLLGGCVGEQQVEQPATERELKRWPAFTRFLDDGRICLTNNAAERALRGVALGRRACGGDRRPVVEKRCWRVAGVSRGVVPEGRARG
jgi:transposase IS66 family protein